MSTPDITRQHLGAQEAALRPDLQAVGSEQAEFAPVTFTPEELRINLFEAMRARQGVALGATALYRAIYGRPYDSDDLQEQLNRKYIQFTLQPDHGYGAAFYNLTRAEGMAVQRGYRYDDRENSNLKIIGTRTSSLPSRRHALANTNRVRVYRMFADRDYMPNIHATTEMLANSFYEWEPAIEEVDVVARDPNVPVRDLPLPQMPMRRRASVSVPAAPAAQPKAKESKTEVNLPPEFTTDVDEAIELKVEEGLMLPGDIDAKLIRQLSSSKILGTAEQRKRLFDAGIISRDQRDVLAPLTATQLVAAALINSKRSRKLLGQKRTKLQKAALGAIDVAVNSRLQTQDQNS